MTTATNPTTATTMWSADPAHSSVTFSMRNFLGTVSGRCPLTEARVSYDRDTLAARVHAVIDIAGITTGDQGRDGHIRSEDLLDVATHPTMTFTADGLELDGGGENPTGRLDGRLTLRGITKGVSLRLRGLGHDVFPLNGSEAMVVVGETELSRSDFGISFNMPWNSGTLMGDAVAVRVELLLLRDATEAGEDQGGA